MRDNITYDMVSLVAKYYDSDDSRSSISTDVEFGGYNFKLPVVPANMKCVIDFDRAEWLSENGYFYIMHRFEPYDNIVSWCYKMNNRGLMTSISIGVNEKDKRILEAYKDMKIKLNFITIDVAHGHCRKVKEMIKYIKDLFPNLPFIIAGNVMTKEAVMDLMSWGADCAKVGVGPGAACTTRLKTGFHSPMFSTIDKCSDVVPEDTSEKVKLVKKWQEEFRTTGYNPTRGMVDEEKYIKEKIKSLENFPIIADGGVRHNGDIFKAIVAGAKMVMAGSLFSSCVDSPAEDVYNNDGVLVGKQYYGSASEHNKGHKKNVEGKLVKLSSNGMTYEEKLNEIEEDIQSAISYSGHTSLRNVKGVEYIIL